MDFSKFTKESNASILINCRCLQQAREAAKRVYGVNQVDEGQCMKESGGTRNVSAMIHGAWKTLDSLQ